MILIAESGSTKTEWSLVEGTEVIEYALTDGINPYFQTRREISHSIRLQLPEVFFKRKCEHMFFYGAGCTSDKKKAILEASLIAQLKTPATIESDLLAAARALFQKEQGIGCILGTGSNSCYYNGDEIEKNVRSLGYILGDEGSGSVLGRMFLADCLKEIAPKELIDLFYDKYKILPEEAMESVYNMPFPNRFLSSFSFFLIEFIHDEYVYDLVYQNFKNFFNRCILQYNYTKYPIRFMGSVAHIYSKVLEDVARDFGLSIESIVESPMAGLIEYHSKYTHPPRI